MLRYSGAASSFADLVLSHGESFVWWAWQSRHSRPSLTSIPPTQRRTYRNPMLITARVSVINDSLRTQGSWSRRSCSVSLPREWTSTSDSRFPFLQGRALTLAETQRPWANPWKIAAR
jgi:hypothetical protein